MQLTINNIEEVINPVVFQLPAEIINLYNGLLKYISIFGYEVRSEKVTESISIIAGYLYSNPQLIATNLPVAFEPEPIELPVINIEEFETEQPDQVLEANSIAIPEQPKPVRAAGTVINIDPVEKPAFFAALGNLAKRFQESFAARNPEMLPDTAGEPAIGTQPDTEGEPAFGIQPEPEEIVIEIVKSNIPNIHPDKQHIVDIIRVVTNNEVVTRSLISTLAGSMNKFCKYIAEQSVTLQIAGEVNVAYSWQSVYLTLVEIINFDAVNFEVID